MNERIKRLAEMAVEETESRKGTGIVLMDEYTQRLAELIVRECIAKCNDLESMKYIADHFNVQVQGL